MSRVAKWRRFCVGKNGAILPRRLHVLGDTSLRPRLSLNFLVGSSMALCYGMRFVAYAQEYWHCLFVQRQRLLVVAKLRDYFPLPDFSRRSEMTVLCGDLAQNS
jgi:hypothetical protein